MADPHFSTVKLSEPRSCAE